MPEATATTTDASGTGAPSATTTTDADAAALGDPGKRALDAERNARKAADDSARAAAARVAELEAELKKRDDEKLSETDKLRKQLADAEAKTTDAEKRAADTVTRSTIEREAGKLRFADPEDAWGLLDATLIEYGKDGKPTNARALLEDLAKRKPYLVGSGRPAPLPGGGATPSAGTSMDDWLRSQARGKGA
jgi:hypothetical protein